MPARELSRTIYDRLTSPISGVFLFSWCALNWPVLIILIFGNPYEPDRVAKIREYLLTEDSFSLFFSPLIISAIYLLLMPIVRDFYEWFIETIKHTQDLRKRRDEHDLIEISQYRDTLKAINSVLANELSSQKAIATQIITLSQPNTPTHLQQAHLSQITEYAKNAANGSSRVIEEHNAFLGSYTDRIPVVTRVFLKRWKNQ